MKKYEKSHPTNSKGNIHEKKSYMMKWMILCIVSVIMISATAGCVGKGKVKKENSQNETVTYNDIAYSITNVEKTKEPSNDYSQPEDGYEYVKVTIKIENKSNKKASYNALNFQMVNSNNVQATMHDIPLGSGELEAGKTTEGTIIWEQKQGETGLKIRYYENLLSDDIDDYAFQWTLDK